MYKKIYLVLTGLFLAGIVSAQKGTITGVVIDEETKTPVPFLNVLVEGNSAGTLTNDSGMFKLIIEPGTYTLVFSSMDYEPTTEKVVVTAGQTTTLNKTIKGRPIELITYVKSEGKYEKKLEELTVTMEVLKPNIVNNKNATTASSSL